MIYNDSDRVIAKSLNLQAKVKKKQSASKITPQAIKWARETGRSIQEYIDLNLDLLNL